MLKKLQIKDNKIFKFKLSNILMIMINKKTKYIL